jgi:hypothetical protein
MMYERTIHEIKYHSWTTGPQGMRFKLYPVTGRNTVAQVQEAKTKLRREQDVVSIGLEWITEQEWREMKIFLHTTAEENNFLNKKYHELFNQIYN